MDAYFDLSSVALFGLLNLGFALVPGPDLLCIVSTAVERGKVAALAACAGIAGGSVCHAALAAAGVSAMIAANQTAMTGIRMAGGLYLGYVGVMLLRDRRSSDEIPERTASTSFRRGFMSNLLNPKVLLCFLAVLPTFIDTRLPVLPQVLVLSFASIFAGALVNVTCALAIGRHVAALSEARMRVAQGAVGVMVILVAARAVLSA